MSPYAAGQYFLTSGALAPTRSGREQTPGDHL
jgi:hypothetical protein